MAIESDDDPADLERNPIKTVQLSSTAADLATSLPPDIITEILIRLPLKFLLRFKCVCRSWRALISDPTFVKNHLRASADTFIIGSIGNDVKSCSLLSVLQEESPIITHALDYPLKNRSVSIVGSLNGLVCIVIDKSKVFLWNPSTRISKRLPHCGIRNRLCQDITYGFGYDEGSSQYKVVVIYSKKIHPGGSYDTQVMVYGLKSDSWKMIVDFPKCYPDGESGKLVSGSLHWDASIQMGLSRHQRIASFDLSKETYYEILPPCFGEGVSDSLIGVLSGCLSFLCDFNRMKVDVWVMKHYGKIDSWSKLFSLPFLHGPIDFHYSTPLYICKKNEVFVVFGSHLMVYNAESNTVRYSVIHNFSEILEVDTYVESLVSPYPQ